MGSQTEKVVYVSDTFNTDHMIINSTIKNYLKNKKKVYFRSFCESKKKLRFFDFCLAKRVWVQPSSSEFNPDNLANSTQ